MDNVEIVKGFYAAFGRGDVGAVLATLDPNLEWRGAEGSPYQPDGKPWFGPDAVMQNLFMKLASEWEAFTVHPQRFHDAGDTVVAECRYSGVHKATGKTLDAQSCHIWEVNDGKLASWQQYLDTAQMQDVVGTR
jgi:uncharacterized protein